MAPKKRRTDGQPMSSRVTRSSTRRVNGSTPVNSVVPADLPKKKKAKTSSKEKGEVDESSKTEATVAKVVHGSKTIVIEHCKQCNSFKTRAIQVKNGLENGLPGITVLVNPEKPRRGCFEIREEGGEKFTSLLDMKRPFAPMKALDMDKVISDMIDKMK